VVTVQEATRLEVAQPLAVEELQLQEITEIQVLQVTAEREATRIPHGQLQQAQALAGTMQVVVVAVHNL
jgi:hypothetical protein